MDLLIDYIFVFLFGLVLGSFLNVVVYRLRTGRGLGGRSHCMSCGKTLTARMLVPIFSYLFLLGRCAHCKSPIAIQYPLVELSAGMLTMLAMWVSGFHFSVVMPFDMHLGLSFATDTLALLTLLGITVYDFRHKIIPDTFAIIFALAALAHLMLSVGDGKIADLITGFAVAAPFAALWLFSGGKWMGLGDAKLAIGIGWLLGYPVAISAIVLAFWLGTPPALVLLYLRSKGKSHINELPFAPFLALATVILYAFPIDMLQLHLL